MKMFVCRECGQINGHFMGCPEMPEAVDLVEDLALDEMEAELDAEANREPIRGFPRFVEQDADE